jgi:hypothetical protein
MIIPWFWGFLDSKFGWTFNKSRTDAKYFSQPYTEINEKITEINEKINLLNEKIDLIINKLLPSD